MNHLIKTAVPILGVVVVAAGVLGLALTGGRALLRSREARSTATPSPTRQAAIPHADPAAPGQVKTATFALG
jgi:hypothetical protein